MTQTHLEGMEPPSVPDLDDAIARWQKAETARANAITARTAHAATITGIMRAHNIEHYKSNGWVCTLMLKDIIHVKPGKTEDDPEDHAEGTQE